MQIRSRIPELPEESSVCSFDEMILTDARKLKKNIMDLLDNYALAFKAHKVQTYGQLSKDN
jgi:hypothetical protein